MDFSDRKYRTNVYSTTIFQFIKCIISYKIREISAYCELISCTTALAQFHLQSSQIRWLDLTVNCAYSQLSINNLEVQTFISH